MNDNELSFKIIFTENKRDKYKYETYKIDKKKIKEYGKYLDESIVSKLNVNIEYTVKDIYAIFEKTYPLAKGKISDVNNLIDYLEYRDVFNNYSEWIILLKKILELLHINDYTSIVKKTSIGVCLDLKREESESETNTDSESEDTEDTEDEQSESENEELHKVLIDIFAEIGIITKDKSNKFINPSFFKIFGIDAGVNIDKTTKVITNKKEINFNEFFPGKSNGKIVRYLKIYKMIPIKDNYDKNDFKKELIDTEFVEVKKNEIYYKKECLEDLKEWIADKILN